MGNTNQINGLIEAIDNREYNHIGKYSEKINILKAISTDGITPLLYAIQRDDLTAVHILLDAGADPEFGGIDRPLYEAIRRGNLQIVNLLIKNGVDPNSPDVEGYTPLMVAAACNEAAIAQRLIDLGGDVTAALPDGTTVYDIARINGSNRVIRCLLATGKVAEYKEDPKLKKLLRAARDKDFERVIYFLDQGAPINGRERDARYTVLMEFSECGDMEAVKQLIKRGADPAAVNNYAALEGASRFGHLNVVKYLLDHGAHPNNIEPGHTPAILSAACFGHLDVLKLLIDAGADLSATDCMGKNVMTEALDYEWRERRKTEIVDFLISIGVRKYTRLKDDFVKSIRPELVRT
jgi:ankyrin repeat protein